MKAKDCIFAVAVALAGACACAAGHDGDGLWRDLEEKNRLHGPSCEADDFLDMIVLVGEFGADGMKEFPFAGIEEAVQYRKEKRCRAFCSLRGTKMNAAKFKERVEKQKMTVSSNLSVYQLAGATNEPSATEMPFFYVVGIDGAILHKGNDFSGAVDALEAAQGKLPPEDPIFGIAKIDKLAGGVTNHFAQGKLMRPGLAWLKKMSADKDAAVAAEAKHLTAAILQMRELQVEKLVKKSYAAPGMTQWELEIFLKMWPDLKADKRITAINENLKQHPEQVKVTKIVLACEKEAQKPIKKAADAKKAAAFFKGQMARLDKLISSKDVTAANEASTYKPSVEQRYSEMLNWTPPAKTAE